MSLKDQNNVIIYLMVGKELNNPTVGKELNNPLVGKELKLIIP